MGATKDCLNVLSLPWTCFWGLTLGGCHIPSPIKTSTWLWLWAISFRSIQIAKEVVELMWMQENECLWETYKYLHESPESSIFVAWLFKVILHCMLSDGRWLGPMLQCIHMVSNSSDLSSLQIPLPLSLTSWCYLLCHYMLRLGLLHELTSLTPSSVMWHLIMTNTTSTLTVANNPLFDLFTIDLGPHIVAISISQKGYRYTVGMIQ